MATASFLSCSDGFCSDYYQCASNVITTSTLLDAGAQVVAKVNTPTSVTASQTVATPLQANTLTVQFTVSTGTVSAIGARVYIFFPPAYETSMSSTVVVSGVVMYVCTATNSCTTSTNYISGSGSFDGVRLTTTLTTALTASTTYGIITSLTNPVVGAYNFAVSGTSIAAGNMLSGSRESTSELVVSGGTLVSNVTGSFAMNTPTLTNGNTLTVGFQDSAALAAGATVTIKLSSAFADATSPAIASTPTVGAVGVSIASATFSSNKVVLTLGSAIAANTAVSVLIDRKSVV